MKTGNRRLSGAKIRRSDSERRISTGSGFRDMNIGGFWPSPVSGSGQGFLRGCLSSAVRIRRGTDIRRFALRGSGNSADAKSGIVKETNFEGDRYRHHGFAGDICPSGFEICTSGVSEGGKSGMGKEKRGSTWIGGSGDGVGIPPTFLPYVISMSLQEYLSVLGGLILGAGVKTPRTENEQ